MSLSSSSQPFDAAAAGYDRQFTHSLIGRTLRAAVWQRCAARFTSGSRILEMNCGTGEDAIHLAAQGMRVLATDVSPAMLGVARAKAQAARAPATLCFRRLAWEDLAALDADRFDGVLSNFGGLNCVSDLRSVAPALARQVRPGGWAMLCVMGRHVPWEWLWYLGHGQPRKAFRRLSASGVPWNGLRIFYPDPGRGAPRLPRRVSLRADRRARCIAAAALRGAVLDAHAARPRSARALRTPPRGGVATAVARRSFPDRIPTPVTE